MYLFIHCFDDLFRHIGPGLGEGTAQEYLMFFAQINGADLRGHAVFRYHTAGDLCGALEIAAGTGCDIAEDDILGNAAAEEARNAQLLK